jgi:thiamine pyrophosphokinase
MAIVIVAGGELTAEDLQHIRSTDRVIAVDGGAKGLLQAGMHPQLVVGDFDTLTEDEQQQLQEWQIPFRRLPTEKDLTDTQYAIELALQEQGPLVLLGFCGGARLDHALANLYLLEAIHREGRAATLYYRQNRLRYYKGPAKIPLLCESYTYVSVIPVSDKLEGVSNKGLKYPLQDAILYRFDSRGVSNEWIQQQAEITFQRGSCFIVESREPPFGS